MKTPHGLKENINQAIGHPEANRFVTDHIVNGLNESLEIAVCDSPGQGGASHHYQIRGIQGPLDHHPVQTVDINFQNGPIKETGINGISQEALLAVVIDRLRSFQAGPFACRDNAVALTKLEEATMWLHKRTNERMRRGVEGTNQK
jgi:hypothetical protein